MYCTAKIFALGAHFEVVIAVSLPAFALLRFKKYGQIFAYHPLKELTARFGDDGARLL